MLNYLIYIFKKIARKLKRQSAFDGMYAYRKYLFEDLKELFLNESLENSRVLEIGPKDGEDTHRILSLNPKELILFDLPDKTNEIKDWKSLLRKQDKLIIDNFMYLENKDFRDLGKFDLIYFTGVLYHNPEQLRFLNKLYEKLNSGGILVLETATIRNPFIRRLNIVQIWHPKTYRNTTTISHLPSKKAVTSWLEMVGFSNIRISNCYDKENFNVRATRLALIAEKKQEKSQKVYYEKQIKNSDYFIGGSS